MKMKHISVAAILVSAMLFSSCVVTPDGHYAPYGTYSVSTNGYSTSVAWTNASYDANGFPIFGYSYGRPVYGYTEAGVAIFTVAALTALCFVPRWAPAPWYHGHWHYPPHCHHVAAPPRYPHGHAPGVRPHGGMNAPIHRNPAHVFKSHPQPPHGHHGAPSRNPHVGSMHRPNNNHHAARPQAGPNHGNMNRPGHNVNRPTPGNMNRPSHNVSRPNSGSVSRPSHNVSRPSMSRPSGGSRPSGMSRPSGGGGRRR